MTASASLAYLRDAITRLPTELRRAAGIPLPELLGPRTIVTTGVGASEGPARLLAFRLASAGLAARFVPLLAIDELRRPQDLLVVFSQGLSPNARLAFPRTHPFAERLLVTSVTPEADDPPRRALLLRLRDEGVRLVIAPPATESGTLVRFVGPTVASLVAARLAAALGDGNDPSLFDRAADAYTRGTKDAAPLPDECDRAFAIVGAGVSVEELFAPRWKLLETFLAGDPPVWDALSFAHGPVQAMHGRGLTLLVFEIASARTTVERLAASIDAPRHSLVRLRAESEPALAFVEHAACFDAAVLASLEARPRDLFTWPRRGAECPLYALGDDEPG